MEKTQEKYFNVEDALRCLVKRLNEQGKNLENPEKKESHEHKPLIRHVRECWDLSDRILRKLEFTKEALEQFCFSLCVVHDLGKLDPKWQIRRRKLKLKHAKRSREFLDIICKGGEKELARLLPLSNGYKAALALATLRHHSSLFIEGDVLLQRELRYFLSKNIPIAVDIADTIGVFKLADIVSALNLSPDFCELLLSQFEWPMHFETSIDSGIKNKAKEKRDFDSEKYKLQNNIGSTRRKHLVVVAPTGWGKTALGLLRVKNVKPCKVFYILPTITAIREFEQTLRNIFGRDHVGEYFYFADVEYLVKRKDLEESEYPVDFYRYFVPKIVITTIDQLLLTSLQFGKYHLRRYNLRKSLLIFDEFHLLTPQMVGALKAFFENLANIYNFSVLLMSATPSTVYINALEKTLKEYGGIEIKVLKSEYRRLKRHHIEVKDTSLFDFLQEKRNKFKRKKVLIISNTVDKAINAYDILQREADECKVNLIHSRFAYIDRTKREDEAKGAKILVSTQVAEVSLDISYDVLITELAPIPALIQRFGRVNRYGGHTADINVYICMPESEKPYSRMEFIATKEVLNELSTGLQRNGESVYLDVLDNYYEKLTKEPTWKIERMYECTKKELARRKYFYCATGNFSEIFGREPSCLAIPNYYLTEVKQLKGKMKGKPYGKRKELLANLKNYFISVPYFIINEDGEWNEELGFYTVGIENYVYDPKRGLIKRDS
jgi:CRISPR-associated endonuclease/helicase Cas3